MKDKYYIKSGIGYVKDKAGLMTSTIDDCLLFDKSEAEEYAKVMESNGFEAQVIKY